MEPIADLGHLAIESHLDGIARLDLIEEKEIDDTENPIIESTISMEDMN